MKIDTDVLLYESKRRNLISKELEINIAELEDISRKINEILNDDEIKQKVYDAVKELKKDYYCILQGSVCLNNIACIYEQAEDDICSKIENNVQSIKKNEKAVMNDFSKIKDEYLKLLGAEEK